jgi:hypothetical protein
MKPKEMLRTRKFQKRTQITAAVLILLIAVVGFLVLPRVVKPFSPKKYLKASIVRSLSGR